MMLAIISRILDPILVLGFIAVASALRSGMTRPAFELFLLAMFLGMVCLPLSFLAWAIKTKRVSDWDLSVRQERVNALTVFIPFLLLDFLLVYFFGNLYLLRLFLVFSLWFIGFFAVTIFWKISGHVSASALATAFLIRWFGWSWWPILVIVPFIAWVRVKQKNHTPTQTVAAALYSWAMFLTFIYFGLV